MVSSQHSQFSPVRNDACEAHVAADLPELRTRVRQCFTCESVLDRKFVFPQDTLQQRW